MELRAEQSAGDREVFSQGALVELLDDLLGSVLRARTTGNVSIDIDAMARRFGWAVDRLSLINETAAKLVLQNTESSAWMQALGDRIDRSNAENQRVLDEIVRGVSA